MSLADAGTRRGRGRTYVRIGLRSRQAGRLLRMVNVSSAVTTQSRAQSRAPRALSPSKTAQARSLLARSLVVWLSSLDIRRWSALSRRRKPQAPRLAEDEIWYRFPKTLTQPSPRLPARRELGRSGERARGRCRTGPGDGLGVVGGTVAIRVGFRRRCGRWGLAQISEMPVPL
jgi:hypothetical protein